MQRLMLLLLIQSAASAAAAPPGDILPTAAGDLLTFAEHLIECLSNFSHNHSNAGVFLQWQVMVLKYFDLIDLGDKS